ncbi:hypothetical protein GCM10027035_18030 [Emticicia sediminis]
MNKIIIYFILGLLLNLSCSAPSNNDSLSENNNAIDEGKEVSKIFGIEGEDIPIREEPSEKSKKIVNQKATEALHKTEYCVVDYSVKVEVLEEKNNWSKIKVIDPDWLSDSHIGWIPSKYLLSPDAKEKQSIGKLNPSDYEIIKTKHNETVDNFHVYLKSKDFDKEYVYQFTKQFRKENCNINCNVYIYDSKAILPLVEIYPLPKADYLKLADHFISMSTFDATEVKDWYPYQDLKYKEYGGKNWKKEPIK